jgi:hypothetical protein
VTAAWDRSLAARRRTCFNFASAKAHSSSGTPSSYSAGQPAKRIHLDEEPEEPVPLAPKTREDILAHAYELAKANGGRRV